MEYMKKANRPYSLINIFDNLHGKVKKIELQKKLDNLVVKVCLLFLIYIFLTS